MKIRTLLACALLPGFLVAGPSSGADVGLALMPHLIRPGSAITVKPGATLTAKSFFLRLSHIGTTGAVLSVTDLPLDTAEASRGLFRVTVPGTMTQGGYTGEVINEQGAALTASA